MNDQHCLQLSEMRYFHIFQMLKYNFLQDEIFFLEKI